MGRHTATGAVFVDETGRRAAVVGVAMRIAAVLVVGTIGVLMLSVVGKVPLPGISPPAALPSAERALPRQQRHLTPSASNGATTPSQSSTVPQPSSPSATGQPAVATPHSTAAPSAAPSAVPSATPTQAHGSSTHTALPTKAHGKPTALPTHR